MSVPLPWAELSSLRQPATGVNTLPLRNPNWTFFLEATTPRSGPAAGRTALPRALVPSFLACLPLSSPRTTSFPDGPSADTE